VIARGFAGPSLLAMILVEKYANHQPLNRQSEQYAREGIELSVSTMADHVGACTAVLMPLYELIKAHVFAAERIHGDDTTVPCSPGSSAEPGGYGLMCAMISRLAVPIRRPPGSSTRPIAVARFPSGHLASYAGILQADAYAGFNTVYKAERKPGPIIEATYKTTTPATH